MIITDIEANDLLGGVTKFHCAWAYDTNTDETVGFRPDDFSDYLDLLESEINKGGLIAGHNFINYDSKALKKLAKLQLNREFEIPAKNIVDTLVLVRLLYSEIGDMDAGLMRSGKLPGKKFGSHSLEAWGYRLGQMKGEYSDDFKKAVIDSGETYKDGMEWVNFSEEMYEYCLQDVVVTTSLMKKLLDNDYYFKGDLDWLKASKDDFWSNVNYSVILEHEATEVVDRMMHNGYPVNLNGLNSMYEELAVRRGELLGDLVNTFGSWFEAKGGKEFIRGKNDKILTKYPKVIYPKSGTIFLKDGKTLAKTDKMKDAPYTPVEYITFNPSSRDHIAKVLIKAGWVPEVMTDGGKPKVDETVLQGVTVEDEEAQRSIDLVREYLTIQKLIGQVAEGDNGWIRCVRGDGRIHGFINPNGAVTGRATHSKPNMAQVPSNGAFRGEECRSMFGAHHNKVPWVQLGVDASGLELRCLGHFMAKHDEGHYADTVVNGDIHWFNAVAAGLAPDVPRDKHNEEHTSYRNNAKTFIYGFLYGAGAEKVGKIVNGTAKEGKELIDKFLSGTPAIKSLRESILNTLVESSKWVGNEQKVTWKRKWVKGIDGRKIAVRTPHAALNTLLQGAGAIICKKWVVETDRLLQEKGLISGWKGDYCLMAWIHDEQQLAFRTRELAELGKEVAQQAMRNVESFFKFKCRLDTDGAIGETWRDTH